MNDDLAMGYVLGTLDDADRTLAERLLEEDRAFAESVERARGDVDKLARGMARTVLREQRRAWLRKAPWPWLAGAVFVAASVIGGILLLARDGGRTSDGTLGKDPATLLAERIQRADVIVVGRVTSVVDGIVGSTPSAIATIEVEQVLKGNADLLLGAADDRSAAVDSSWASVGERHLLFLDRVNAVVPSIAVRVWRVLDGPGGRYLVTEDGLAGATFTIADVRAQIQRPLTSGPRT